MEGEDIAKVINALRSIVQSLRTGSRHSEKKLGLSGAQLFVLRRLQEESPLSINELAIRTHTHQSSVSVVVSRLAEKKLLTRMRAKGDNRRVLIELTNRGKQVISQSTETVPDRLVTALEELSRHEQKQLGDLLIRVLDQAGLHSEAPAMFFEPTQKSVRVPTQKSVRGKIKNGKNKAKSISKITRPAPKQ